MMDGIFWLPDVRRAPDDIRIVYVYKCEHCGAEYEQVTLCRPNGYIPYPDLPPAGWRKFGFDGGVWICQEHTIEVKIDGQQTNLSVGQEAMEA